MSDISVTYQIEDKLTQSLTARCYPSLCCFCRL